MRHEYNVLRAFDAVIPISGSTRRFDSGASFSYDTSQVGPTVTIEADMSVFLVDRSTIETCCEPNYIGPSAAN